MSPETIPSSRRPPPAVIAGCAAVWALSVVAAMTGTGRDPFVSGALQALVVGAPMVAGLAGFARGGRFARLLTAAGVGLALAGLMTSSSPLGYSVGRVALWCLIAGSVYMVLAFPTGRLEHGVDRLLAGAAALTLLVLYLPTVPFTVHFPLPFPWVTCGPGCPDNVFAVVDRTPAVVGSVIAPVREAAVSVVLALVALVLARRTVTARPPLRAAVAPVFIAFCGQVLLVAGFVVARRADPSSGVVDALGWLYVASFPVLAVSFGAARIVRTRQAAIALERLAHALRAGGTTAGIGQVLARSTGDASMRLLRRTSQDRWVDCDGCAVALPTDPRTVTLISAAGDAAAAPLALVHDAGFSDEPDFLRAAGEIALLQHENERLVERLTRSLEHLTESRARLVEVADRERRRIERDLHDGAQQGLVGVRIRLSLIQERLEQTVPAEAPAVEALAEQVEDAIDQLRTLARGLYPALLTDQGLAPALRAAARVSPVPTTVDVRLSARPARYVESMLYFACLEGLQNAAKHAAGATAVAVEVWEDDPDVHFEVRDDGAGFEGEPTGGSGLRNIRERMLASGGRLRVASSPGAGTRLLGTVPLRPPVAQRSG